MGSLCKTLTAAAAVLAVSTGSAAAEGWVGGVRGGALTDIDFDSSIYLVGAFAGYDFADDRSLFDGNWRLQGEFSFSSEDNGFVDAEYYTFTAAAYREFATGSNLRPYLVAGAGGTHIDTDFAIGSDWFFSLPVGAGLAIDITDYWSVDLDYRVNIYQDNGDFSNVAETSEISAYIRYNLGGGY